MKKIIPILLVTIVLAALIAGGCAEPAPAPTPTPTPAPTPTPTPEPELPPLESVPEKPAPSPAPSPGVQPKFGGILKIAWPSTETGLFGVPWLIRGQSRHPANLALERVVQRSETDPRGYEGVLAKSYELAPDKSYYDFHLRQGVKFHDGTDLNAQAVKWNWDHLLAIKDIRGLFAKVDSFEVIDDYTLRANLLDWDALVLDDFRHEAAYIMSPTAYEQHGEEWCKTHPVGTGPFTLKAYEPMRRHAFERNPDYWNQPYPYLDGMEYIAVPDAMTRVLAFKGEEFDVLLEVPMNLARDLKDEGYKQQVYAPGGTYSIEFGNMIEPESPFYDVRVREALEYALDKEKIALSTGLGFSRPMYEILRGANDIADTGATPRKYDPDKARQLLAEAGYADGFKVSFKCLDKFYGDHFVAAQAYLGEVGIEMDIDVLAGPAHTEIRFALGDPYQLRSDRTRGQPSIIGVLYYGTSDFASSSINYPGASRPAGYDDLLDQAKKELDPVKQAELIGQMEKLMYDHVFLVPILNVPDLEFVTEDLLFDPSVRENAWWQRGDRQIHWEIMWLDR